MEAQEFYAAIKETIDIMIDEYSSRYDLALYDENFVESYIVPIAVGYSALNLIQAEIECRGRESVASEGLYDITLEEAADIAKDEFFEADFTYFSLSAASNIQNEFWSEFHSIVRL